MTLILQGNGKDKPVEREQRPEIERHLFSRLARQTSILISLRQKGYIYIWILPRSEMQTVLLMVSEMSQLSETYEEARVWEVKWSVPLGA